MFKEKPSSRTVRQRGEAMENKMTKFADSYFGHDKAHAQMVRAEIKAAGKLSFQKAETASHKANKPTASQMITKEAQNVLQNIKTFEGDAVPRSVPAEATIRTQSHAKTVPTAKNAAASKGGKDASFAAERKELEEDVEGKSSTSTTTLQMPAKVRAVQKIAAQVFGQHNEKKTTGDGDAALRKQLTKDANMPFVSRMDAIERDAMQELKDDSKVRLCFLCLPIGSKVNTMESFLCVCMRIRIL